MTYSLIIKGDRADAKRAARKRGIRSLYIVRELTRPDRSAGTTETVAYAHPADLAAIVKWFGEVRDAPFPPGTLLIYTNLDEGRIG